MAQEVSQYSSPRYRDAKLDRVLQGKSHQHSRFTDVNGKDATFEGYDFSYCIFTRAYFHNTTFSRCKFIGSYFIDCNFRNSSIRDCEFSYANFVGTRMPTKEIVKNLPSWPNARRELLQILRRNAVSVGDYKSERIFVIREIDSEKEHYRRAWKQDELYYQRKYGSWFKRFMAGAHLLALKTDNFIWGHGERLWKAAIALIALIILLAILSTALAIPSADKTTISVFWDYFYVSFIHNVNMLLGLSETSGIKQIVLIDWIIVLTRFLVIGVVVAALYRRLSHR